MEQSAVSIASRRALLVSVAKEGSQYRICLDDVISGTTSERTWVQQEHVTNKLFDQQVFSQMEFDEKELANLGYYIMARLKAFIHRHEI